MRKLKLLSISLVLVMMASALFGCYIIKGQNMSDVKGTYKLTRYTYTPQYERREGYTPRTYNYIEDEDLLYEDYLIITGDNSGYYVHKDVNTPAFSKGITLAYEYNQEDSSKVDYVIHNDAISVNSTSGVHRIGVNGKILNHQKQAIDISIFGVTIRTEDLSIRWEKVSNATDLSYVEEQLGTIKKYDYNGFGVRGIYDLNSILNVETSEYQSVYQYYLVALDAAQGVTTAKIYYALKETPTEHQVEEVGLVNLSGEWSNIKIGEDTWSIEQSGRYTLEKDGIKYEMVRIRDRVTDELIQSIIDERMPIEEVAG